MTRRDLLRRAAGWGGTAQDGNPWTPWGELGWSLLGGWFPVRRACRRVPQECRLGQLRRQAWDSERGRSWRSPKGAWKAGWVPGVSNPFGLRGTLRNPFGLLARSEHQALWFVFQKSGQPGVKGVGIRGGSLWDGMRWPVGCPHRPRQGLVPAAVLRDWESSGPPAVVLGQDRGSQQTQSCCCWSQRVERTLGGAPSPAEARRESWRWGLRRPVLPEVTRVPPLCAGF